MVQNRRERRYPRVAVTGPAFVADANGGLRRAEVVDVSVGGISLVVDEQIHPHTDVTVVVGASRELADGLPALGGEVRWCSGTRKGQTRLGIAFTDLSREAESRLFALWFRPTR